MDLWPHQEMAIRDVLSAIQAGQRRICLTSPTGGGKTRMASELIRHYLDQSRKAVLYTNRRILIDQTAGVLEKAGHMVGVRAAGHEDARWADLQVSSVQTEASRVLKKKTWTAHEAELVLVDEAHVQTGDTVRQLLALHLEEGAAVVGLTATPLDLGGLYDHLITAGTNSELRQCGALVMAHHYGPDEPDLRFVGKFTLGEDLTIKQQRQAMGGLDEEGQPSPKLHGLFGSVLKNFERLNPDHKPSILFGPGVAESIWFAEQFSTAGIPSAHIDGKHIWIDGELHPSTPELREEVLNDSRMGRVVVLTNRFVLREGLDCPWLEHGVFAAVFGSLQTYLQSAGRLLRAHPGCEHVTLQDHGGNWHRHGSVNADREWRLGDTNRITAAMRQDRLRDKDDGSREPALCPACHRVLNSLRCPCGHVLEVTKKSRPVLQEDGSLKFMTGEIYKPHRTYQAPDAAQLWERMYHRARSKKWNATFAQAEAMFCRENEGRYPARDLPLMPLNSEDRFRKVSDVPADQLVPKKEHSHV